MAPDRAAHGSAPDPAERGNAGEAGRSGSGIDRLRQELARQGGELAASLARLPPGPASPGGQADGISPPTTEPGAPQLAAAGPRSGGRAEELELLLEMILEGSELHYGSGRALAPVDDDLALLLGDQLYALGLQRLAATGDLEAVAELADIISLVAQAGAEGERELAGAVWRAGAVAIGWGGSDGHERAKQLARRGDAAAARALGEAAARAGAADGS